MTSPFLADVAGKKPTISANNVKVAEPLRVIMLDLDVRHSEAALMLS